jgi:hypothetical protein
MNINYRNVFLAFAGINIMTGLGGPFAALFENGMATGYLFWFVCNLIVVMALSRKFFALFPTIVWRDILQAWTLYSMFTVLNLIVDPDSAMISFPVFLLSVLLLPVLLFANRRSSRVKVWQVTTP